MRPVIHTLTPDADNAAAIPFPKPEPPPVMIAFMPLSSMFFP